MNDNNNSRLNITLENEHEKKGKDTIFISIVGILKNLKRFFALWLAITIMASILSLLATAATKQASYKIMTALVSFSYSGIEKGLDPKGHEFNINTMKNPQIIEKALEEHNIEPKKLETIRKSISFKSITPKKDAEKLTAYKDIYLEGTTSSISAVKKMLGTKIYPTQYIVYFDYSITGLSSTDAAALLNTILENYSEYFMEAYGYNKTFGNSLSTLDYKDYDYAEAVDIFETNLDKLSKYVTQLSSASPAFRSSVNGYTFRDLRETISTLKTINLDRLAAYITINTVSKDHDKLLSYYQFRKEKLERHLNVCKDTLASVNASIKDYEQNTVMLFGNESTEDMSITPAMAAAQYDKFFEQKQSIQDDLSETTQKIDRYEKRINKLSQPLDSTSALQIAKVEEELEKLNDQTCKLIELVNETSDDYYKTVVFSKSYNILVPANSTYINVSKQFLKDALLLILIIDALLFIMYFGISVVFSCIEEYTKHNLLNTDPEPNNN